MQQRYLQHYEFRDRWSDMLFSTTFLLPVLESVDVQVRRAHIFARPGETPSPIDDEVAFRIVAKVAQTGPVDLGIQTRQEAGTCVYGRLVREYVVPMRRARKNAFAAVGAREVMIAPPPGVYRMRNPLTVKQPWGLVKHNARTCNDGKRGAAIQEQKAAFRALGY